MARPETELDGGQRTTSTGEEPPTRERGRARRERRRGRYPTAAAGSRLQGWRRSRSYGTLGRLGIAPDLIDAPPIGGEPTPASVGAPRSRAQAPAARPPPALKPAPCASGPPHEGARELGGGRTNRCLEESARHLKQRERDPRGAAAIPSGRTPRPLLDPAAVGHHPRRRRRARKACARRGVR